MQARGENISMRYFFSELPPSPEYRLPEARPVLAGTVLPTSTTDTEVEEPSQEVLVSLKVEEEAKETKSESENTSGNQIICDKEEEKQGADCDTSCSSFT